MLSMTTSTAHVALYDNLADWEFGHLLVELRTGRFTGHPWKAVSVAGSREPITSRGGLRMVPDMILDPADSNLLILPGADMWDAGGGTAFAAAAICGATAGPVRAGLLDNRRHTRGGVSDESRAPAPSCSPAPRPDTGPFAGSASWRTRSGTGLEHNWPRTNCGTH
jgi:putative intracellular protease/amidase